MRAADKVAIGITLAVWLAVSVLAVREACATVSEPTPDEIAAVVLEWAGHECGYYCTDARRDGAPDRSADVVDEDDAHQLAIAIMAARVVYPEVPVSAFLAVAWHESSWQTYAVGPGGECGAWQQTPRYVRPEGLRESLASYDDRCDHLQDLVGGALSFGDNAARWMAREGDDWLCFYHRGYDGCDADGREYQREVGAEMRTIQHNLDAVRRAGS